MKESNTIPEPNKIYITRYECPTCHKQHEIDFNAKYCCINRICSTCKITPVSSYISTCEKCNKKLKFDRAIKLTEKQYFTKNPDFYVYDEETEQYFPDIDSLEKSYKDKNKPLPNYVWGTTLEKITVDIESAIQDAIDQSDCTELEFDNPEELVELVNDWNQKNYKEIFMIDYYTAILINKERNDKND